MHHVQKSHLLSFSVCTSIKKFVCEENMHLIPVPVRRIVNLSRCHAVIAAMTLNLLK
jgi:hypothetical protein